jgi:hypothetical protein
LLAKQLTLSFPSSAANNFAKSNFGMGCEIAFNALLRLKFPKWRNPQNPQQYQWGFLQSNSAPFRSTLQTLKESIPHD